MTNALRQTVLARRLAGVAVCVLVALAAAYASRYSISLSPPRIGARSLVTAGASAHIVVDSPRPLIGDDRAGSSDMDAQGRRAVLLSNVLTSRTGLTYLGRRAGIDPTEIAGVTRVTANVPTVMTEPDSERRAAQIAGAMRPYRIEVQPSENLPSLNVYAQAPSVPEAQRLAEGAAPALRDYVAGLAKQRGGDPATAVRPMQVGAIRAGIIGNGGPMIAGVAFLVGLSVSAVVLALLSRRRRRRSVARAEDASESPPAPTTPARPPETVRFPSPTAGAVAFGGGHALAVAPGAVGFPPVASLRLGRAGHGIAAASRRLAAHGGDWPRTSRPLPWMIAGMLAVVWLVPFNSIVLEASLPIDLKFDRLVLPLVVATWVLSLASGGPAAPRVRPTWIHVALGASMLLACLSLILDAGYLSHTLELQTGIKKLTLLGSYVALFVVVASSIRPGEVPAFMKYTLVLAAICALGTVYEYRFHYNVFYSLPEKLLPGIFHIDDVAESSAVDDIGRRLVRGPGEIPLEAVAMMVMALPIALVGIMQATRTRGRILYAAAACLLLAAMISTARKSAFMAPAAVILTLAYFRRRELLRLAPLALVLVVVIHIISPGALGSVSSQLETDRLAVNTVSDRTSDYDAIRPDVWSHLAFGRGYGTYEHTSYRILDMELLDQLVEVGVLGMAAYLLMIGAVIGVARGPIRARRPRDAPVALTVAAAAVAFLVASTLFDSMSFPHCPYIFLFLAAVLTVAVRPDEAPEHAAGSRPGHARVLPTLARARLPVMLGALAAVGAGFGAVGILPIGHGGAEGQSSGMARARVLVDTRHSLVDDLRASADAIGAQTALLSDFLAADPNARAIARAAGVPPGSLTVLRPAATTPTKLSPLATDAAAVGSRPSTFTLTVTASTVLPIVTLDAVAPTRRAAARLVEAGASELSRLESQRAPSPARALSVKTIDPVQSVEVTGGRTKRMLVAIVAALAVFGTWCMAIVIASGIRPTRRAAAHSAAAAMG